ncbi:MAG: Ig-like domain-containing protein [Bacteroidales bacterium]
MFNPALCLSLALFLACCANPSAPTGGPRDVYPPQMLGSEPPNATTGFESGRIRLYFDEFVKLNNPAGEVFISPPLEETPEYKTRGKSVIIDLNQALKDSTTYSIFLGKAVTDITEGNPMPYTTYVFSTGDVLDSLSLAGRVMRARDLEPQQDVLVMLYPAGSDTIPLDSVPYLIRPFYVAKTLEDGSFVLNNLRPGKYKMFALNDMNKNYLYDQPTEEIAFVDSLVSPYYFEFLERDSISGDTAGPAGEVPGDTMAPGYHMILGDDTIPIPGDTLHKYGQVKDTIPFSDEAGIDTLMQESEYPFYELMLFQEVDSSQRLLEAGLSRPGLLVFIFRMPVKDPAIIPLDTASGQLRKIEEWNPRMDTLNYWVRPNGIDSMRFVILDDTLVLDTLDMALKEDYKGRRMRKEDPVPEPVRYNANVRQSRFDIDRELTLTFSNPILHADLSEALLIEGSDTLRAQMEFKDTVLKRRLRVVHKWKPDASYKIMLPDSVLTDWLDQQNDSIHVVFRTRPLTDYGIIRLNMVIQDPVYPYIVQLMDTKDRIIQEVYCRERGSYELEMLDPGDYQIKAIQDRNGNKKWDTGIYLEDIQPEKVFYYPEVINVRANWDVEESWELDP